MEGDMLEEIADICFGVVLVCGATILVGVTVSMIYLVANELKRTFKGDK
jgi:hypothetical protein